MANINFTVDAKIFINFTPMSTLLIREQNNVKNVTLNYSSGTGQQMTAGQVLYIEGTAGQPGYLEVTVNSNTTLSGTGTVDLTVDSHPTATQTNQAVSFDFDESTILLNLTYNSKPVTSDVNIGIANRGTHDFTTSEFVASYTDFDGDSLSEIMATGTLTGYEYDLNGTNNYLPYVSGTWIPINNVTRLRRLVTSPILFMESSICIDH